MIGVIVLVLILLIMLGVLGFHFRMFMLRYKFRMLYDTYRERKREWDEWERDERETKCRKRRKHEYQQEVEYYDESRN